jgi:hypothetical protein
MDTLHEQGGGWSGWRRLLLQVITGAVNPAGRLTATWYQPEDMARIGDITDYRMHSNATSGFPGRTYRYFTGAPLYPFGYGLSYTTFAYAGFAVRGCSRAWIRFRVEGDGVFFWGGGAP